MSALIDLADNSNVYDVAKVSALSIAQQLSKRFKNQIYLKREDDQVIHSFKLRGAYQKMSSMSEEQKKQRGHCLFSWESRSGSSSWGQ